jgi:hypothetical protein
MDESGSGHRLPIERRPTMSGSFAALPARPDRISVTRRVAASAHLIFLLVSDPARHVEIDGSGMLQAAADATKLTEVGQTFEVDMDRRPLGDIPNMAEYKVRCTVTQLIADRLIVWRIQAEGKPPAGHVWGWEIEPLSDGECLVSHYCDWTHISDELRARFRWPVVPVDRLERSVDNLDRMVTQPGQSGPYERAGPCRA